MSTVARLVIALFVGPGLGAVAGQNVARAVADHAGLEAGAVARWEMSGLLIGLLTGLVFAALAIVCTLRFRGAERARAVDPVLLPLGVFAVLELLLQRRSPAGLLASVVHWETTVLWLFGLAWLMVTIRRRPRPVPIPEEPPPEPAPEPAEVVDRTTWDYYVSEEDPHE